MHNSSLSTLDDQQWEYKRRLEPSKCAQISDHAWRYDFAVYGDICKAHENAACKQKVYSVNFFS